MKETELRDEFLYDVFRDLLGYTTANQNPAAYSFTKEQFVAVDGTFADAGFGRFGSKTPTTVAVLEGKSPLDPLDRPYHNRKRSAFEQALLYAYNQRCDWFLVTNLRETRLYHKGGDQIFARKGIDIEQYPAIKRHLEQYRTQLEPKPRDWEGKAWPGRKPGSYRWYELQDAVDYYQQFDKPKFFYQVIQFHPCYSWDKTGMLGNDKTFCIPSSDLYLLGVLNSPVMWWHNWRHLVHLKDEALSPMGYLVNALPIPRPTDELRARVAALVPRLIDLKAGQTGGVRAMLDWLQTEMGVGKVSQKLAGLIGLSADELVAEVRKLRGKKAGLSVAELKRLKDEHATTVAPLQALARESAGLELAVSDAVNEAFGLTPADVKLMWDTAPPRMPICKPIGI